MENVSMVGLIFSMVICSLISYLIISAGDKDCQRHGEGQLAIGRAVFALCIPVCLFLFLLIALIPALLTREDQVSSTFCYSVTLIGPCILRLRQTAFSPWLAALSAVPGISLLLWIALCLIPGKTEAVARQPIEARVPRAEA